MMKRKTNGLSWVGVAVAALAGMACTCGGLGQAGQPTALATSADDGGTTSDYFQVPKDIPVYSQNTDLLGTDELVGYESQATLADLVAFYEAEMPKNGWTQTVAPVATSGRTEMTYKKDDRTAVVAVVDNGGQRTVSVSITK